MRWGKVLGLLDTLDGSELLVADIEDSVDALEEDVAEDVEGHGATRLDTTIDHVVACIGEGQSLLLDVEHVVTHGNRYLGELICGSAGREDVALLSRVVRGTWDGRIDSLAHRVTHKHQGGACVSNGGVAGLGAVCAVDAVRGRIESPEALGVVDWSILDLTASSSDGWLDSKLVLPC